MKKEDETSCDSTSSGGEKNSLEEKIDHIGGDFRGLWKRVITEDKDRPNVEMWSVTFVCEGEIVETPMQYTKHGALDEAIKLLKG